MLKNNFNDHSILQLYREQTNHEIRLYKVDYAHSCTHVESTCY